MPIAFRKDATAKVCLKADEDRPEDERVYFLARFVTYERREQFYAKMMAAELAKGDEVSKLLEEALAIAFIGPVAGTKTPDGRDVPQTVEGIKMVLTPQERWELAMEYPGRISLGEVDLKKFALPSPVNGEASAKAPA